MCGAREPPHDESCLSHSRQLPPTGDREKMAPHACSLLIACFLLSSAGAGIYDFGDVLSKSILFYEAQRSGPLPATNRIPWRGNSAMGDRGVNGEDLTGGWFDAGDHVKFGFPQAFATSMLLWGLLQYQDAYVASNQYQYMLDCVKWPLDYFIKAHPSPYVFYGQVGSGTLDHNYWGRPEDMTMPRPAFMINSTAPGSDLAGITAAAMAQGYLAFKDIDATYAATLLQHAVSLYDFATTYKGNYSDAIADAANYYPSTTYKDELAYAAAWLYLATGGSNYLNDSSVTYYESATYGFGRGRMHVAYKLLLYQISNKTDKVQLNALKWYFSALPAGTVARFTPLGLLFMNEWGSLCRAENNAFVALIAAELGINTTVSRTFAKTQVGYALGDTGRSFVVGYGTNPPTHVHHRAASCPWPPATCSWNNLNTASPNPHVLTGALVEGPNGTDYYNDLRTDYVHNEVSLDCQSGFQSSVAGLLSLQLRSLY